MGPILYQFIQFGLSTIVYPKEIQQFFWTSSTGTITLLPSRYRFGFIDSGSHRLDMPTWAAICRKHFTPKPIISQVEPQLFACLTALLVDQAAVVSFQDRFFTVLNSFIHLRRWLSSEHYLLINDFYGRGMVAEPPLNSLGSLSYEISPLCGC